MTNKIDSCMVEEAVECRAGCAACCIAPSISSAIPDMPNGKAAGMACIQLDEAGLCKIFGLPERPKVCSSLKPTLSMCGENKEQAMAYLTQLEKLTS